MNEMNIIFQKGFSEETGARLITMAIALKTRLSTYTQDTVENSFVEGLKRMLFVPMLQFKSLTVTTKKGKQLRCDTRYLISSKYIEDDKPCLDHINEDKLIGKVDWLTKASKAVLHATLDSEQIENVQDLFDSAVDPNAHATKYFYSETECEYKVTYSLAVVNYYGTKDDIHCKSTTYFSFSPGEILRY